MSATDNSSAVAMQPLPLCRVWDHVFQTSQVVEGAIAALRAATYLDNLEMDEDELRALCRLVVSALEPVHASQLEMLPRLDAATRQLRGPIPTQG